MPPFVHLAIVQFRPRKADYRGNLARLAALFAEVDALEPRPAVVCLPETALTGYFLEGGVRDQAVTAGSLARDLDAAYRGAVHAPRTLDVALGFYEVWRDTLFNSAMYVTLGGPGPVVHHVHRKVFLPTYGLFDEERFVERGREVRAFDTPWGRAALLVCEDAWHSLTATVAALDGAQVVIVPTAPPARGAWPDGSNGGPVPASIGRWERLARDIAEEHGIYVVLANLVGSEGGKMFPGAATVAGPKGDIRVRGPLWEEAIVTATLDLGDLVRTRADMPLIADLETMAPHLRLALDHRHELADDLRTSSVSYAVRRLVRPRSGCGQQPGTPELGLRNPGRGAIPQHGAHLPLVDAGAERLLRQPAGLGGLGDREATHVAMFAGTQGDSSPSDGQSARL
jgi:NAD+ synthase (glutamine-hydrolysing)